VTAVNPTTNATTNISVGPWPLAIAVDPTTDKVYVSDSGGSKLTVITLGSSYSTSSITVGSIPEPLAIDSNSKVYVGINADAVKIVNTASGNSISTVSTSGHPQQKHMILDQASFA
jgi:DNA-binding beta-propeller fold protein YncE